MGMKQTLAVINRMEADGIIGRYAVAGAVAAYNYIEATLTEDIDILVSFDEDPNRVKSGLVALSTIFSYLKDHGYVEYRKEGLIIEGWPVQFLPVANGLDEEALANAEEVEVRDSEIEGTIKTRVLRPEHIVAIALRVGRPKDFIRVAQFLEEQAVDSTALRGVLSRHHLLDAWRSFCSRTGINDPGALEC